MIVLGLTGSVGMGKSTTAAMFREIGVPVHDADAAVHRLYEGPAARLIERLFPGTTADGRVDRTRLAAHVLGNPTALARLESAIHPLVRKEEQAFLSRARQDGAPLVVLDIPLLFETGSDQRVDGVVVVTAGADEQRRRVLARPGMTEEKLNAILERQTPDAEKRRRADFLVDTGLGFEVARERVREIVEEIASGAWRGRGRVENR
jgi:dephospho-CoA kinase